MLSDRSSTLYFFLSTKTFPDARSNAATATAGKKRIKSFPFLLMIKFIFPHSSRETLLHVVGSSKGSSQQDFFSSYFLFLLPLLCVKQHQSGTPRKCRKKDQGPLRNEFVLIMRLPVFLGAVFGISILRRALIITGGWMAGFGGEEEVFIFI